MSQNGLEAQQHAAPSNQIPLSSQVPPPETTPTPRLPRHDRSARRRAQLNKCDLGLQAEQELNLLQLLKHQVQLHHEALEDPDVALILAESETSLLELLDQLIEADTRDEALIYGLKAHKDTVAVRLHRLEERRASRRAILEQSLSLLERKTLERPLATLTLTERPPSLVIEEEALVPARFFDLRPALNRRLAKEALEAGEDVPGARLSNGVLTLTVRRR